VLLLQAAAHDHIPLDPKALAKAQLEGEPQAVPKSEERPSIEAIIEEAMAATSYREQIVHHRVFEAREARVGSPHPPLSDDICTALRTARGIDTLYMHQSQAIDALYQQKHVIVSTSTASGKSVIYQVPLLRFLQEDPEARAIFIYPTKVSRGPWILHLRR
jgi:DEAD/DEAH box helicase domain-containing protein